MPGYIKIREREIGPGRPCLVIAEAGVNHNGSLDLARWLVDAAVAAGADAVKFQTFRAEKVISPVAPKAGYQARATGTGESQLEMVKKLELPFEAFQKLKLHCDGKGITFLSTAFDEESVDFIDGLGVGAFKVPSGEITNLPLLQHIAHKRRPVILSTGMSELEEVRGAVQVLQAADCRELVLLHCVSDYPAADQDANLRAMKTLEDAFGLPVGYSDHTRGIEIALAAVALGACILEKHFTLDRNLPGPDHKASLEPAELEAMVEGIRRVQAALGDGRKHPAEREKETAAVVRRSLVAARDLASGTVLTEELIAIRRPGTGLPPAMRVQLVGRRLRQDVKAGSLLTLEMLT